MMTKQVRFEQVEIGDQFIGTYGQSGQLHESFTKTAHNMGYAVKGNWPMPFLYDEKVAIAVDG